MKTYMQKDPMLHQKIEQTRRQILLQKGATGNNFDGWKIVGLAQRKYRRKWINIDKAISMCDEKFRRHKVVCITIDVEEAHSAEEQLLMHRSLDAFIGVHGAQLTQGVLLPSQAYVLELLPWVPSYLMGDWVATVDRPTPLGIIFHNTDLNHVGYALDRDSVPLCLHVDRSDETHERDCLMNTTNGMSKKFRWDIRDFAVRPKVIEDFISSFLLQEESTNSMLCDDKQQRAVEKNFVFYNAYCRQDLNSREYHAEHYYYNQTV